MITILFAVLALLAVLWVAGPILEEKASEARAEGGARSEHDPARVVLDQIADLDLEHAAGKIPDAAYKAVRADLAAQASAALSAADAATGPLKADGTPRPSGATPMTVAAASESTEATLAGAEAKGRKASTKGAVTPSTGFCPECGKKVAVADKFCAHCGHKIRG